MAKKNWHNNLVDLCKGLGETRAGRVDDVCHATFIAKRIFGLKMPDDYEREGKAMVSSPTVIREHYLIDEIRKGQELNKCISDVNNIRHYLVGGLLSHLKRDQLRFCALYLAWGSGAIYIGKRINSEPEYKFGMRIARKLYNTKEAIGTLERAVSQIKKANIKLQTLSRS